MVGRKDASRLYLTLSERIKHGVKEELLPLVWIPGVGRVRARALYSAGFRKPEDIVQARDRQAFENTVNWGGAGVEDR
jgi:helicase